MHYFQFEIKEWLANTAHLSLEEEAVYLRLINWYYDSEKPIPRDTATLFRKLRMVDQCGIAQTILNEFFVPLETGEWIHKRCDAEIERYKAKIEQASKAGKASAERRSNDRSTTVQPIINHKSLIINQESNKPKKAVTPDGFDLFWDVYDKKVGKPNSLKAWSKIVFKDDLLQKIVEKARADRKAKPDNKFRKDPERWLKGQHWLDEVVIAQEPEVKELPLGTDAQIEAAYRAECGDPAKSRFGSYYEMRNFIIAQREKRKAA